MVKCKECGAEISPKAKACPQCGADPRSWWGRRNIVSKVFIGFWVFVFIMGIYGGIFGGGEVKEVTETTVPPITTQAPVSSMTTLSLSEQKKFLYELVAEEDKCNEKFEITLDPKDLPGPECGREARARMIEKYNITTEEMQEISMRGIREGWPMPTPPPTPAETRSPYYPLELYDLDWEVTEYSIYATGKAKNVGTKTLTYAQIEVNFYATDETILGSSMDNINNLAPNEVWSFRALYFGDERPKTYKISGVTAW